METWLVTGAAGFLGANVGARLQSKVHLVGQTRVSSPIPLYAEQRSVDLRKYAQVDAMVREVRPDVVLHTAAVSGHETCANDPDQAYAVNVGATRVLAEASADIGARFVNISTDAVFSGESGDYREEDPPEPFSLYGETKLLGELSVAGSGAHYMTLRTNFFGWSPVGRRSILEFFVEALRSHCPVDGYPDFVVTTMYVQTLAEVIWRLDRLRYSGLVNVASSDELSKHDFGVAVARCFGLDEHLIAQVPSANGPLTTSRSRNLSLNTDRLAAALGAVPQTQAEGIEEASNDEAKLIPLIRGRQR